MNNEKRLIIYTQRKGGGGKIKNLMPCCKSCNSIKADDELEVFRMRLFWNELKPADLASFDKAVQTLEKKKFYFEWVSFMKSFLLFLIMVPLVAACDKYDEEDTAVAAFRRTVVVYMSGENNLSSYVSNEISKMTDARKAIPKDCNLLLYVDRADKNEKPFVIRINSIDKITPVDTVFVSPTDPYSSDEKYFREILRLCVDVAPSRQYGLVLWGHGNGWLLENDGTESLKGTRRAWGVDNGDNTTTIRTKEPSRWLNITQMAHSLENLGIPWHFLFFDGCNMQCIEVAYELKNVTQYVIASPAEVPATGFNYSRMLTGYFAEDDKTAVETIADTYHHTAVNLTGCYLPVSIIETSKLERLAEATAQLMPEIENQLLQDKALQNVMYYHNVAWPYQEGAVMYDMTAAVTTLVAKETEDFLRWQEAMERCFISRKFSRKWMTDIVDFSSFQTEQANFAGVSMFFPLPRYNKIGLDLNKSIKNYRWWQKIHAKRS